MSKKVLNLICLVYSGRFIDENTENNIGHENINFFEPEFTNKDNKWLIWFNPGGLVNSSRLNDIDEINVMLVTNDFDNQKSKFSVLALFRDCQVIEAAKIPGKSIKKGPLRRRVFENEFKLNSNNNIFYFNKTIQEIFKDNKISNKTFEDLLATFWTKKENVFFPKNKTTIKFLANSNQDEKTYWSEGVFHINKQLGQSMRLYLKNEEYDLQELIQKIQDPINSTNDPKDGVLKSIFESLEDNNTSKKSFFGILRLEKDELAVSNAIAHSLTNPILCKTFIKCLADKSNMVFNQDILKNQNFQYVVKREKDRVDIQIKFSEYLFVIENKIDSSIIEYRIDEIKKWLTNEEIDNFIKSKKVFSQLSKYFLIKENELKNSKTKCHYFLLVPEYRKKILWGWKSKKFIR